MVNLLIVLTIHAATAEPKGRLVRTTTEVHYPYNRRISLCSRQGIILTYIAFDFGGPAFLVSFYVWYTAIFAGTAMGIYYFIRGRIKHEQKNTKNQPIT